MLEVGARRIRRHPKEGQQRAVGERRQEPRRRQCVRRDGRRPPREQRVVDGAVDGPHQLRDADATQLDREDLRVGQPRRPRTGDIRSSTTVATIASTAGLSLADIVVLRLSSVAVVVRCCRHEGRDPHSPMPRGGPHCHAMDWVGPQRGRRRGAVKCEGERCQLPRTPHPRRRK